MACPLVQLGPQGLGTPVVELGLDLVVLGQSPTRLQSQGVTERLKAAQHILAQLCLHKALEVGVRWVGGGW